MKRLESKRTKMKNVMQLLVESEKADFHLEMGKQRKKMTARTYRAQFKPQRIMSVVLDNYEAIEGPDAVVMDEVAGPPDSVDSESSVSLPRSQDSPVHSVTVDDCRDPTDINGVMIGSGRLPVNVMENVVGGQPSYGNCVKGSCVKKLHTNSSSVKSLNSLEKEASTCSARLQDGVVSESDEKCMHTEATATTPLPASVNDNYLAICKNACYKRQRVRSDDSIENDLRSCGCAVKDLGCLCTCKKRGQSSNESPREPNTNVIDEGNKRSTVVNENVEPESVQVELIGHRVTQVTNLERGPSVIAICNLSQSLQKTGATPASNLSAKQISSGEMSLSNEQKSLYSSLLGELMKLCSILKLTDAVTHMARRFLEYGIKNHHIISDSPEVLQASQISLCWVAASVSKQTVDKEDSLMLARQHLNYQCEKHIEFVFRNMLTLKRMYLHEQNVNREPFNGRGAEPASSEKADANIETGLKSLSGEHGGSETDHKILLIEKKCRKRQMKLQRKHQEKICEFHKIWDEKREQLDKDLGLETAFVKSLFTEPSVRTERLKRLNDAFSQKLETHSVLKDVELKHLEAEQLAAMNEEKQKADRWLTQTKAYATIN